MKKKEYTISVHGCDDSSIFNMKLSDEEFDVVDRLCKECTNTSTYSCMPVMQIEEIKE